MATKWQPSAGLSGLGTSFRFGSSDARDVGVVRLGGCQLRLREPGCRACIVAAARYTVVYRDRQGRQHKRSAASFAEARLLKAELARAATGSTSPRASAVTLAQYLPEWLAMYAGRTSRGVRAQTLLEYRRDLERHALPFFGSQRLSEIEPRDVKRFITSQLEQGLTSNTVRRRLAPLRALFATASEDGLIRANPAAGVRVPRSPRDRVERFDHRALSEAQLRRLLDELPVEARLFAEFASATGAPLDYANIYRRAFKPAARRAGVPWAGFHTLRHTCASILFRYGLSAKHVQLWLGHHSPAYTLATYVHLSQEDLPNPVFLDALTRTASPPTAAACVRVPRELDGSCCPRS